MSERFVVAAVAGWTIRPGMKSGNHSGTSFSVIGTADCCLEVGQFYCRKGARPHAKRLAQAQEFAAQLNQQDAKYAERGVEAA